MVYAVAIGVGVMTLVIVIVAFVASRDDPIGLGRTMNRPFTDGLGTIFGGGGASVARDVARWGGGGRVGSDAPRLSRRSHGAVSPLRAVPAR